MVTHEQDGDDSMPLSETFTKALDYLRAFSAIPTANAAKQIRR